MYRTIDCATWDDPWFAELSPNAKLLFLYFITNRRTSAAGCFEITRRAMMFESGLRGDGLDQALDEIASRVTWWPELQVVFVRNFYKHQGANSNRGNFRKAAMKALAEFPELVQVVVLGAYPELAEAERSHDSGAEGESSHGGAIPNPSPTHGDKETVTVTETEQEGAHAPARANGVAYPSGFLRFWGVYPRKVSKDDAFKAWKQVRPTAADLEEMVRAIERQKKSTEWCDEGGRFIPHPGKWLRAGRWKDEGVEVPESVRRFSLP